MPLRDFATALLRHWRLILFLSAALASAAGLLAASQKDEFSATAALLFRDPNLDQAIFGTQFITRSTDPAREAATNLKLVSLGTVATRVAKALREAPPPGVDTSSITSGDVSSATDLEAEGQSDLVSIHVTQNSPALAAAMANAFAEQYIAFRREADRDKVTQALDLVNKELNELTPEARAGEQGKSLLQQGERLQIFQSLQTGNAEIVERATAPSSPSAPRPLRSFALGGFAGLIIGGIVAWLLEKIDRRVRDPRRVQEIFDRPLIGTVPRFPRKGPAVDARIDEAYSLVWANLRFFQVDEPLRSVLVTSAGSGEGKTTTAWHLAKTAAELGVRVILVETDMRRSSISQRYGLTANSGLSQVLAGRTELGEALERVDAGLPSARDVLLAGPIPPNPTDLLASGRLRDVLDTLENWYDIVIIDSPPISVVPDAIPLLQSVSGVLVVARIGFSSLDAMQSLNDQLTNLNAPVLGVVANAAQDEPSRYAYVYAPDERGSRMPKVRWPS